ncbi:GH39 family glycosyl hydrolase [Actinomadura nitritigenes]|uniref:GH39 family glycosyl hydrolase n=1 Tax=Actinomadura nitritigenes TaxID=134602 RepID=UPI003D8DD694
MSTPTSSKDGSAPASNTSELVIDAATPGAPVRPIWSGIGYDELNWTYTPRGRALHHRLGTQVFTHAGYDVRNHNAFTSGNGLSAPAWGCGDPVVRRPDGSLRYRWDILDRCYDTIVGSGGRPFVELGFMPRDLSSVTSHLSGFQAGADVGAEAYEAGAWKHPPEDPGEWAGLVRSFLTHLIQRYGESEVLGWKFELWNEPDLPNYWRGSVADYLVLWDVTAQAVRQVHPDIQLGGPATTAEGTDFLRAFCEHVSAPGAHRPDFLSFHSKGANFFPRRTYQRSDEPGTYERAHPSSTHMLAGIDRNLEVIAEFPELSQHAVYVDECDPAVGTIYGVHDNPNFVVANSEYYGSFVAHLAAGLLDRPRIERMTHWAFYMEGKRWFEGNRTLIDNDDVAKPILHVLGLLDRLGGGRRLPVTGASRPIGAIASRHEGTVRILVWNHDDAWWSAGDREVRITVRGVAGGSAVVHRVDREHANAYRAWEAAGSPEWPDPDQAAAIAAAARPASEQVPAPGAGEATIRLRLPMHAVALIEIPAGELPLDRRDQ